MYQLSTLLAQSVLGKAVAWNQGTAAAVHVARSFSSFTQALCLMLQLYVITTAILIICDVSQQFITLLVVHDE